MLDELKEAIYEVFPDAEDMALTSATRLEELPEWDSMAVVNLQTCLEQTFQVSILQDQLSDELTIGELVTRIKDLVQATSAA